MMLSLVSAILRASRLLLPLLLLKCSQLQAKALQASADHGVSSLGRTRGLKTQVRELKQDPALGGSGKLELKQDPELGGSGKLHHHFVKVNLLLTLLPC